MIICPICGTEFNPYTAGRTKTYCNDNCRNYSKTKDALERQILAMRADKKHTSTIRGDMFRLANLLSCGTKTSSSKKEVQL